MTFVTLLQSCTNPSPASLQLSGDGNLKTVRRVRLSATSLRVHAQNADTHRPNLSRRSVLGSRREVLFFASARLDRFSARTKSFHLLAFNARCVSPALKDGVFRSIRFAACVRRQMRFDYWHAPRTVDERTTWSPGVRPSAVQLPIDDSSAYSRAGPKHSTRHFPCALRGTTTKPLQVSMRMRAITTTWPHLQIQDALNLWCINDS
ncbi:hypothetical protein C8R46DRAFT_1214683 [Mycena filopes]|nr:hypothetical protein C8R46DRAFT_1214683 [Mycena filopes]